MSTPQQPGFSPYEQVPTPAPVVPTYTQQPAVYVPPPTPMTPPPAIGAHQPWRVNALWALLIGVAAIFLIARFFGSAGNGPELLLVVVVVPIILAILVVRALIRVGDKRPPPVVIAQAAPTPVGPPAGWYTDPSGVQRWFDGVQWTEFTQPM